MKKEDKELLLKDLCARLSYNVICHANEINLDGELLFINKVYSIVALYNDKAIGGKFNTCPIADVKPYLRSMSSMTEEEKENFGVPFTSEGLVTLADTVECIDWLNAHHFDYHGLISCGLALEAPKGMYKAEQI